MLAKVFAVGSSKSLFTTAPNRGMSGTAPLPSSAVAMEAVNARLAVVVDERVAGKAKRKVLSRV